jgi:carnitine-CoA ligase
VLAFPGVREAAAVAVRSEIAEDEVMAVIALKEGETFDPAELIAFLRQRMAHFMVPRYVRIVDALPRTPTAKIEKVKLRAEGLTPDTWDRELLGGRLYLRVSAQIYNTIEDYEKLAQAVLRIA